MTIQRKKQSKKQTASRAVTRLWPSRVWFLFRIWFVVRPMQFFSSIILERRVPPQITSDLQFVYKNFLCNVFVVVLIAVVLAFFFDWQPIPRKTTRSWNQGKPTNLKFQNLPWFLTGVTYPFVLQSTVGGRVSSLKGREVKPRRSVSFGKWEPTPRINDRYSSTVRSPNWFMAKV